MNKQLTDVLLRKDHIQEFLDKNLAARGRPGPCFVFDDWMRPELICENEKQSSLLQGSVEVCLDGIEISLGLVSVIKNPKNSAAEKREATRELRHLMSDIEPYWGIFQRWVQFQAEGARFREAAIDFGDAVSDALFANELERVAREFESSKIKNQETKGETNVAFSM